MRIPQSKSSWQHPGILLEQEILGTLRSLQANSKVVPSKSVFIQAKVEGKAVLDLGCIGHSELMVDNQKDTWLHHVIRQKASSLLGVDFLQEEVLNLQKRGWNVVCQDVTQLHLDRRFQVIVAADVIEHLANFEGFFHSVATHLMPDGELIISTPNALGLNFWVYTLFRGLPLVNPDHTCWFDPKSLIQLARRYGFVPTQLVWIKRSWQVSHCLLHGTQTFGLSDFYTGFWSPAPTWKRAMRAFLQRIVFSPLRVLLPLFQWRRYWSNDFILVFNLKTTSNK